ncbi:MAG TPA: hypothetical protein VHE56_07410 [Mycobacteriales bacterium]|nr:hypothetical protein [Mycobacteriales bacterium]
MRRLVLPLVLAALATGLAAPAGAVTSTAQQWQVPAPALLASHGPQGKRLPNCRVNEIRATARTVKSTYGVLGVVRLRGAKCRIQVENRLVALLDAAQHPLKLDIRSASSRNRGAGTPLRNNTSALSWGFSWRGSWCGAQAIYVRIELSNNRLMRIPVPGRQPACLAKGGGKPVVIRGTYGSPGEPVQTAPPEWSALKAKLHVNPTTSGATLRGLSVTLTNTSADAITLDPCPHYALMAQSASAADEPVPSARLADCPALPTVVPGNRSKTIHLDAAPFNRKDFGPSGTKLTVTFGMAGLAPSAVRTRLS